MTHAPAIFIIYFLGVCICVCSNVKGDDKGDCYAEAVPFTQLLCEFNKAMKIKLKTFSLICRVKCDRTQLHKGYVSTFVPWSRLVFLR